MSFLPIQLSKEELQPFHLINSLSSFLLIAFSTLNSFWFFLKLFFIKLSTNFLTVKITNYICPRHSTFKVFNHKSPSSQIETFETFCKNAFINTLIFLMVTNFKFRVFLIIFFIKSIYVLDFTSTGFSLSFQFQQKQIFLHYELNNFLYHNLETMLSLIFCKIHFFHLFMFCLYCN